MLKTIEHIPTDEIRHQLQAAVLRCGSQRRFAAAHGISNSMVSLVLAGKLEPNAAIANSLGHMARTIIIPMKEHQNVG